MAIGVDNRLRSSYSPSLKPSAPSYPRVSDTKVTNANNNILAGAAGSDRAAQQSMGRQGMSAGRGLAARAQRAQDDATIKARVGAAKNDMDAAQANASMGLAYDNMHKMEALGNQGLLNGLQDAKARSSLNRQGLGIDETLQNRRHQLSMDGIYLNTNPVLQYLLRD